MDAARNQTQGVLGITILLNVLAPWEGFYLGGAESRCSQVLKFQAFASLPRAQFSLSLRWGAGCASTEVDLPR